MVGMFDAFPMLCDLAKAVVEQCRHWSVRPFNGHGKVSVFRSWSFSCCLIVSASSPVFSLGQADQGLFRFVPKPGGNPLAWIWVLLGSMFISIS
jgi:hypothetical protein